MPKNPGVMNRAFKGEGEYFFKIGDNGNTAFIIQSGEVEIFLEDKSGRKIILSILGPNSIFGEMALIFGGKRTANARATRETTVILIQKNLLDAKLEKTDKFVKSILELFAIRLKDTTGL